MKVKQNFDKLIDNVYQTHCLLQQTAQKTVNYFLAIKSWITGYYIVEYEQKGEDRAKYGEQLVNEISRKLNSRGIKGYSAMSLKNCRAFYRTYPQIRQSLIVELQKSGLEIDKLLPFSEIQIRQTLSVELQEEYPISNEMLLSRISYSHFLELIRVSDPLERLFYEVETIKNNWSVRELKRAITTSLALRTSLSTNKESIIDKIKNLQPANNLDIIRSPYVLEFLGLEEKYEYSETDLEQSILNNLQKFLVELGTGFCFEARQKRITFNNKHYRIDLVFYNKILKCNVLIDLKIGEFDHADAGQMNMYLNYYRKNEMSESDNLPIGIILCADKDDALVEFAIEGMNEMFVSKYLLQLPDKKVLENFIRTEIKNQSQKI